MSPSASPGARLGRSEINTHPGPRVMAGVYPAPDAPLDQTIKIKSLPAALASDKRRFQRFIPGAQVASASTHLQTGTIYEIGTQGISPLIATEFEGNSLGQRTGVDSSVLAVLDELRSELHFADLMNRRGVSQ